MQKPNQKKQLPRRRKMIPKNPPLLLKKFKKALFLQIIIFCIKQNPEENLFFLPGLLLPFRYFGSLNELFSETILLNTRCSLDES